MIYPIELEHLIKDYGKTLAVDDVSFQMHEGEVLGLLGPNGAGKTTIISILTCVEKPSGGVAKVFGSDVCLELPEIKSMLGVVPQELVSHGFFSIEEVLGFYSGYHGIKNNKDHIQYLLRRLGLYEHKDKKVRELSGGMKRRFLIAKALVHKPKLLLLDEPTAGVDIELRNVLWDFVRDLNKQGVSILLTTHYLEEAEMLCDRIAIIHKGKLREIGDTKKLIQKLTHRRVEFYINQSVEPLVSDYVVEQTNKRIICQVPSHMEIGELILSLKLSPSVISDIKIEEGDLEDAFLSVVGDGNYDNIY